MIAAEAPLLARTQLGAPTAATMLVCAELTDWSDLVAQVVQAVSRVATVRDRTGEGAETRLRLVDGARVRITAAPPVRPEAHPSATTLVTAVVEDAGELGAGRLAEILAAVERIPLTGREMRALHDQMPLTSSISGFLPSNCLAELAPVLTVHHMTDFLVMVDAICAMGVPADAITVLDKQYRYRHTSRVDAHLRRAGVHVWPWTQSGDALVAHVARAAGGGRKCALVDDGGYTLPVLIDHHPQLLGAFIGLVEQTMSGITRLEPFGDALPVPIFSVAQSRLKATIEPFGVADAAIRNVLALLPQEKFEGQPALVLGFGRIGEQVAEQLRARRMRVAVYDNELVRTVAAHERGFLTGRRPGDLLREHQPLLVVGSTGGTSLRGEHAAMVLRDCYLASTTSRDREFALAELAEQAHTVSDAGLVGMRLHLAHGPTVTVLGDGLPINFHYAESMPNKYADLVLASMLVGLAALAAPGRSGLTTGHNVAATDRILESCGLLERYYARFGPQPRR
jgi:adenosylhomocysteinase